MPPFAALQQQRKASVVGSAGELSPVFIRGLIGLRAGDAHSIIQHGDSFKYINVLITCEVSLPIPALSHSFGVDLCELYNFNCSLML